MSRINVFYVFLIFEDLLSFRNLFCTGLFQYSGWSANNKEMYYPAPIVFKMQNRKETIVEFLKDAIKE